MAEAATVPSDDLRSALAAAITKHETPEPATAQKAAPPKDAELPLAASDAPAETASETAEPKPKKKSAAVDGEATETPDGGTTGAEKPDGKDRPEQVAPEFEKALAAWKPADRTMFKALAPEAQQFVMRRYKEMTADYTKKLQDVSRLKADYEPIDKMFEPYREVMKQKGFTPSSLVESWANVEKKLAAGEQSALEVVAGIVRGYGLPPAKVANAIGVRPQNAPAGQQAGSETPPVAPQIQLPPEFVDELTNLRRQVGGLSEAQRHAQETARAAAGERAMHEIEEFKSAVDAKGTLLRPHFEDVEQDMVRLANLAMASKQPVPSLQELYETAVWANPSTRALLRTAETQAAEQKRVDQEKTKAAAARKAAVSVTGAPGSGQASQVRSVPERSLREEIEAHAAEIAAT